MEKVRVLFVVAAVAIAGIFSFAGCEIGDANIHLVWTINGEAADQASCTAVGGAWVYVLHDENENERFDAGEWRSVRHACDRGEFTTVKHFFSGEEARVLFELHDSSDIVLDSILMTFTPSTGTNDLSANFEPSTIPECGNGECESGETCSSCPEDCGSCTEGAQVQFKWYIHGVQGGVDVGWGSGEAQEVCKLVQDLSELSAPPVVQLWIETTGDDTADLRFDFTCSAGTGLTTEEWESGESLKYAFALVDGAGEPLSQSMAWETTTLAAGVNDFGTVNLYIGDYGPLGVEIQWADKEADPAFGDCDLPPDSVTNMGYLLCGGPLSAGSCPLGMLYDEIEIDVSPIDCRTQLNWDITDYGTYTLVLDGEDAAGATVWGSECPELVVDSMDPGSNEFICLVLMTASP